MSILVTGGAGFIGSNFIHYYLKNNPETIIVNLDKLTYAADLKRLEGINDLDNYFFIEGDICNKKLLKKTFENYNIESVIHFAAESHVDNSIESPEAFIQSNIVGTFNLLQQAYKSWMHKPFLARELMDKNRFHHISTDEVYGTLGDVGLFSEETNYAPNSPYSASKAASDHLVRSYYHTYGLNIVTTNCSNNYGPMQHSEKFIPTIVRNAISEKQIPIYGDGKNIRDWLYVNDHCSGIEAVFKKGRSGETYNIGGNNELTNLEVVNVICKILDNIKPRTQGKSYKDLIKFVNDRPGHDYRYAIDATKIKGELNWKAIENFETGILKTINWYLKKQNK